jgi:dephospho-CoA kinase
MSKHRKSLLLIVGMPGSGKSTAAQAAKALGFRVFSFGDIVREEVRRLKLAENEENVERVANWFHSGREYLLAHRLEKKLHKIHTAKPFYVIEGARSPKQLKELKGHFNVKILAVVLPQRIRWARQLSRHRSDIRTQKDARERDARESRYGIEKLLARADWRISSNCNEKEFRARNKRFFASLLK